MSLTPHKRSSKAEVEDLIRARYSLLSVSSHEEARVEESLRKLCVEREMRLEVWSITEGFKVVANGSGTRDVKDPMKALDHVLRGEGRALYVLRDFHPFFKEPAVVRRLRDLAHELRKTKKSLILLSPITKVPPELEKSVAAIVDWELPTRSEIEEAARKLLPSAPPATQQMIESDPTFIERVVEGALGLTLVEAENVFAKSMVRTHTFDLETILEEKKQIIRKSGLLEYYEQREEFSDVGGMDIMKDWLVKRRNAFSSRARDFGLPLPKGILLIGVPGTGKSLTAKAVGALWQMPLLRLDVGKIFGGLVGSSEENMRNVIKTAEAIAPAILWIDELEKGFSGTASSGQTDGGTTSRVFGSFITWLQEKTTPVFVIATANNVSALPPELLRKGRFDEIFFCDLPDREDRRAIMDIHLRKKGRDPGQFELEKLADATIDYSGAEMEQAVVAALYDAFDTGNDLTTAGLLHTLKDIVPLAVTMREQIDSMREWARTRARPASARGKVPAKKGDGWMAKYGAPRGGGLGDKAGESGPDEGERKLEL
ncbi:MAG: AAA family ATPase [Kofleriaceae bacterium]|jgi:ATP-dependent 26S proteasome regulatory subunit|nr:AAA family ATPase [Kofleriaceae bacterium]MBP9207878.1 AAA family ATPase [Kofleriaceae bacterium]